MDQKVIKKKGKKGKKEMIKIIEKNHKTKRKK